MLFATFRVTPQLTSRRYMSRTSESPSTSAEPKSLSQETLPISAIVRAVCQAASAGPDRLYEVMVKLSVMVEATAPTYGLSIWTLEYGAKPRLKWAEGLDEGEITAG